MTVEERLERLEKNSQNWLLTTIGSVLGSGVFIAVTLALTSDPNENLANSYPRAVSSAGTELRTKKLTIVNQDNKPIFDLAANASGAPTITLDDENFLIIGDSGSNSLALNPNSIAIVNKVESEAKLLVHIVGGTSGSIFVGGPESQPLVSISESPDNSGGLVSVYDDTGQVRGAINARGLNVFNLFGKSVATVQAGKTNEGLVTVHDVSGEVKEGLVGRTR